MKISIENLDVTLGEAQIIKDLSAEIATKQCVGLIGPNGSGKSTLLKTLYRVLKPTGGTIYYDGKDLREIPLRESAQNMAVVAQHSRHSFDFTCIDMVLMGRAPYKTFLQRDTVTDYDLARQAIATVGMQGFEDRSFTELSGGEQQRIILARALAQDTETLILDEPTNHLDITYQLGFLSIVTQLENTVIMAIHDVNLAAMYCDYIICLQQGHILTHGTVEDVITEETMQRLYNVACAVETIDGIRYVRYKKPTT